MYTVYTETTSYMEQRGGTYTRRDHITLRNTNTPQTMPFIIDHTLYVHMAHHIPTLYYIHNAHLTHHTLTFYHFCFSREL